MEELADAFDISSTQAGVLLNHGLLLIFTFWTPRFLPEPTPALARAFTLPESYERIGQSDDGSIVILTTDCTEIGSGAGDDWILKHLLCSDKRHYDSTYKLLFIATTGGLVLWSSKLMGGRVSEEAGFPDLNEWPAFSVVDIVLLSDRGFYPDRMARKMRDQDRQIVPAFLNATRFSSSGEKKRAKIRTSFSPPEAIFSYEQSSGRAIVENINARAKGGVERLREYQQVDPVKFKCAVGIALAVLNRRLLISPAHPSPGLWELMSVAELENQRPARLDEFRELFTPLVPASLGQPLSSSIEHPNTGALLNAVPDRDCLVRVIRRSCWIRRCVLVCLQHHLLTPPGVQAADARSQCDRDGGGREVHVPGTRSILRSRPGPGCGSYRHRQRETQSGAHQRVGEDLGGLQGRGPRPLCSGADGPQARALPHPGIPNSVGCGEVEADCGF